MSLSEVSISADADHGERDEATENNFSFREDEEFEVDVDELLVDEETIQHNVCPETDSDNEDDGETENRVAMKPQRRGETKLAVGQIFFSREDIKSAVLDHALKNCRNIRQNRYDKAKLGFKCIGSNCNWRIWCAIRAKGDKWEVRSFNDQHTCVPNGECDMLKVPVIATLFMDRIREEPSYFMPMKLEALIKEQWGINVSRAQCQKARNMALMWIERYYDRQFERIRDYAGEIMDSNPNSSVDVETYKNTEGKDIFERFYCCYDVLKRTWKAYCRPLIGMDGCFLKGKMKGQLLVALGRDGNNKIYPLAWAVVQKEDTANWLWFLRKLKYDLELDDGKGYVLVSDRQKGLIKGVELELPQIEHRMCVRHIYENLKKKHGKKPEMKPLVWKLAWSYNVAEYHENLARLMTFDMAVYSDVLKNKPETWCRAFYALGSCCEDVENNSTESFNATVVKAREKAIIPMLEMISRQAMVRIHRRSIAALNHQGGCTPYALDVLEKELPSATECQVYTSTNQMFMVQMNGCGYRVSLATRSCTCRKWDIRGIPCEHAYAVMLSRKLQVEDYVEHWFRTPNWINTYAEGLTPARGARFWPTGCGESVHRPPSPQQPGRKKKIVRKKQNRKKARNESPTKKTDKVKKRKMHCAICGSTGHNARYHKADSQFLTQGQAS